MKRLANCPWRVMVNLKTSSVEMCALDDKPTNGRCFACVRQWINGEPPEREKIVNANRGIGDTIASITHATGIAQAVEYVADKLGVDCGCKKRQEALNKLVPYKDKE